MRKEYVFARLKKAEPKYLKSAKKEKSRTNATVRVDVALPPDLACLNLPEGVERRLHQLLDKQDFGEALTADEAAEAEGLLELAELLSLLRLRAKG